MAVWADFFDAFWPGQTVKYTTTISDSSAPIYKISVPTKRRRRRVWSLLRGCLS